MFRVTIQTAEQPDYGEPKWVEVYKQIVDELVIEDLIEVVNVSNKGEKS